MVPILDRDSCPRQGRLWQFAFIPYIFLLTKSIVTFPQGSLKLICSCVAIPNPPLGTTIRQVQKSQTSVANGWRPWQDKPLLANTAHFQSARGQCKQKRLCSLPCLQSQGTVSKPVFRHKYVTFTSSSSLSCSTQNYVTVGTAVISHNISMIWSHFVAQCKQNKVIWKNQTCQGDREEKGL